MADPFGVPLRREEQYSVPSRHHPAEVIQKKGTRTTGVERKKAAYRKTLRATRVIQRWWRAKLAERRQHLEMERQRALEEQQNKAATVVTKTIRRAAACHRPKQILKSLKSLQEVKRSLDSLVSEYLDRVLQVPAQDNKEFLYLEDCLIKILIRLDAVESCGADEVRQARKDLIKNTQATLDRMDAHKSAPTPMEVDSPMEGDSGEPDEYEAEDDEELEEAYYSSMENESEDDSERVVPVEELLSEHLDCQ
jgi:hypothetical protein